MQARCKPNNGVRLRCWSGQSRSDGGSCGRQRQHCRLHSSAWSSAAGSWQLYSTGACVLCVWLPQVDACREAIDSHRAQQRVLEQAVQDAAHARRKVVFVGFCTTSMVHTTCPRCMQAVLATSAMQQAAQHYRQALDGTLKAPAGCHEALASARARHAALTQVDLAQGRPTQSTHRVSRLWTWWRSVLEPEPPWIRCK